MTRTKVIQGFVTAVITAGATLVLAGPVSAQPPKCELATVASKVCPNPGRAGQFDGNDTRPSAEVPGSNGWGYSHELVDGRSTQQWGKKGD